MNDWNFDDEINHWLTNANYEGWDGYDASPVRKEDLMVLKETALDIKQFFDKRGIELVQPVFGPADLHFDSFEKGYVILMSYSNNEWGLYGDNEVRNWPKKEIELVIVDTFESRTILGTFASWCKKQKDLDWLIEIRKKAKPCSYKVSYRYD